MVNKETLNSHGMNISVINEGGPTNSDFMSLTDIAKSKNPEFPADVIKNWLRSKQTIEFLGTWEQLNNPKFSIETYYTFLTDAGGNTFVLSPKKWIEDTLAIGITSRPGHSGGTFAHTDIAFEFASWISPQFRLYLYKDYQKLKANESSHLSIEWNMNRELSKLNYQLHTDAIKHNLIPDATTQKNYGYTYASEADRLNVAVFGQTAKEWRANNKSHKKSKNIRDYATKTQLLVLVNLESYNAEMIKDHIDDQTRSNKLNKMAREQLTRLTTANARLAKLDADNNAKSLN